MVENGILPNYNTREVEDTDPMFGINNEILTTIDTVPSIKEMQDFKENFANFFSNYFKSRNIQESGHNISDNFIGDVTSEIALLIIQKKLDEAKSIWTDLINIYNKTIQYHDLDIIISIFRTFRNQKLGYNGESVYILKAGESRLSLLKSAIDELK